jgi:hypothetical protein
MNNIISIILHPFSPSLMTPQPLASLSLYPINAAPSLTCAVVVNLSSFLR